MHRSSGKCTENENLRGHNIRPIINEVPVNLYRQTSSITNEALKRSRLSDSNTDNTKRKAAILIILKSEDLFTQITQVRSKPIKTSSNPYGYSLRKCIPNNKGEESDQQWWWIVISSRYQSAISCDDYMHLQRDPIFMSSGNSHYVRNNLVSFYQQSLIWNCVRGYSYCHG